MNESHTVKCRFCPSPTGLMHIGNARTALFSALYAKHDQGIFLLRIEDTDVSRSDEKYTQQLLTDLQWMGLDWQEGANTNGEDGPYWQSKRQDIYDRYYQVLEQQQLVYPCFCSEEQLALSRKVQRAAGQPPRYAGTCRSLSAAEIATKVSQGLKPTLRFRIPKGEVVEFVDQVKGLQHFATDDIGDFIIRRADGSSPFMYCNAIDDALMGVTHVVRGEDHLTNSPRQILLLKALALPVPTYCHIALIFGPDGAPLSKRNGSRSIQELCALGYLPAALLNYLARLGHYYADNSFMTIDQLAAQFDLTHLSVSPARFDIEQLQYWQKEAIAKIDDETFWHWCGDDILDLVPTHHQALFIATIRPNVVFPADATEWAGRIFHRQLLYSPENLQVLQTAGEAFFQVARKALHEHGANFKMICQQITSTLGLKGKKLFQPLRTVLTGTLQGPEMIKIVELMSVERVDARLQQGIAACQEKN